MNGSISIESEPDKGSTFTVRLPQGKIDSEVLGEEMVENLHKFRTSSRAQMKRVQITREPMPYGNILIVDDVEINIFVAKGLMSPYKLNIDSADSGFAAIEKIKNGKVYDIIFMDHMMPELDGIEATKIIRNMGYNYSIVALTANAVTGQAEIFLGNGFDDFLSKPIDVRQLNTVLNKLIRDKQPPEVIEAARQQAELKDKQFAENIISQSVIDPHLAEIFVRDATKSISVLDAIIEKNGSYDENDMRMYVIHTHGMKSALANVGKMELSAIALKLEQIGREGNTDVMASETPAFLNLLRAFVGELTPQEDKIDEEATVTVDEDKAYLHEKLILIKAACEEYDESTAEDIITELREKEWLQPTKKLLGSISEHLLHSDFDEIVDAVNKFMEMK
jgi:CheY-like chemotaxis protein/HPt (histidine-containing phosphotransfer) domain-containing protein